ncbi:hypothetical protein [Lactococcus garvieae]
MAVSSLSLGVLTACSSNEKKEETKTELSAEVFTGATAGTTDFETLSKGLSKDGRWHAAITKDIDASGETLNVEGDFKNKAGEEARKLALYSQDSERKVTDRYILTLDTLEVNSPNFYISNGTVKGNVEVNA